MRPGEHASLAELAQARRSGTRGAASIVDDALARIEEREQTVGAWEYVDADGARATATGIGDDGPLTGVPIGVKDIIDTADLPTECGSPIYRGRRPERDAWCVERLRSAGAVVLGKTVTTEFAYFSPGKTRNPRHPEHTPGGSSSGSAAAVADGMVPLALGTQTAGSTVRPAAFCGIASLAITHGTVPMAGISELSGSLDTLGLFTRSLPDLVICYGELAGRPPEPVRRVEDLTLLCCDGSDFAEIDAEMADAYAALRAALADRGVECVEFEVTDARRRLVADHQTVMAYDAAAALGFVLEHRDQVSEQLLALIEAGRDTSESSYRSAVERARLQQEGVGQLLSLADGLLLPAAPGPAPRGLASTGDPVLSRPWHVLGLPAVAIPGYRNQLGLPLGMQLVGAPGTDAELVAAAAALEDLISEST